MDAKLPGLRKITPGKAPLSAALGILGMPGQTSYSGIVDIGRGEGGRDGGDLGRRRRGRHRGRPGSQAARRPPWVGIAGGPDKCRKVEAVGFDACVDYKSPVFADDLKAAVPQGVDVYFENVGGDVTRAVLPLMKYGGRVPMCGFLTLYGYGDEGPGPDQLPWLMRMIMLKAAGNPGLLRRPGRRPAGAGPDDRLGRGRPA